MTADPGGSAASASHGGALRRRPSGAPGSPSWRAGPPNRTPSRRRTAAGLALAVAVATALGACGDGPPREADPEVEPGARPGVASGPVDDHRRPCEVEGFPCTWAEVDPEPALRTHRTAQIAAAAMQILGDTRAVADLLEDELELAELGVGELAVRFRLPGSRAVWIPLPYDPANPRRGGGARPRDPAEPGGTHRVRTTRAAVTKAAPRPARETARPAATLQEGGADENQIAGEEGEGKSALILAPQYFQLGKETGDIYELFEDARDYGRDSAGRVVFHANLKQTGPNPAVSDRDPSDPLRRQVAAPVTIADFADWKNHEFVYLATHGAAVCDPEPCHTSLTVRTYLYGGVTQRQKQADFEWGRRERRGLAAWRDAPGVEITYRTVATDHPGLSPTEARWCLGAQSADAMAPGGKKPCFFKEEIPVDVSVTTTFFREAYPGGLNDVVIFLAVCQALKVGDLQAQLAPEGNHDIAVFGFREDVKSYAAAEIGRKAVNLFLRPGLHHESTKRELERFIARKSLDAKFFDGVVRGEGDTPAVPRPSEHATNPTHARDVVELVNPLTGEELEDGAGVIALGAPDDGQPDRIRVGMRVRGIDDETDVEAIDVYLKVDDRESGPHELTETVEPHVMRAGKEEVELGIDLGAKETVDLEIRAELEGGGESRWSYDSLKLASWTLSVASPSENGRYAGFQGYFREMGGGLGQLSLCSSEGPSIQITAGAQGFDGTGTYVLGNGPDQQQGEVAISSSNWRGVPRTEARDALRAMKNFITGNGESVLHQPDGAPFPLPSPGTLEITRVTEEYVEGSLTGTLFRQTSEGTLELADVSVAFVTRLHDPLEGAFSMMTRSKEMLCTQGPTLPPTPR